MAQSPESSVWTRSGAKDGTPKCGFGLVGYIVRNLRHLPLLSENWGGSFVIVFFLVLTDFFFNTLNQLKNERVVFKEMKEFMKDLSLDIHKCSLK